jgi:hypothetical protein
MMSPPELHQLIAETHACTLHANSDQKERPPIALFAAGLAVATSSGRGSEQLSTRSYLQQISVYKLIRKYLLDRPEIIVALVSHYQLTKITASDYHRTNTE